MCLCVCVVLIVVGAVSSSWLAECHLLIKKGEREAVSDQWEQLDSAEEVVAVLVEWSASHSQQSGLHFQWH